MDDPRRGRGQCWRDEASMRVECAAVLCVVATAARWCVVEAAPDHKWYSSAPVLPALVASSEHIAHPRCYNHSRLFLRALDNYTLWAVQMLDASVKVPDGIVDGSVIQLGHFDQCLRVSMDDLQGQYCLVEIAFRPVSFEPQQTVDPYTLQLDPKLHAWEKLKKSEDRSKITRSILHLGLCLPASCTPDQLQETLDHELHLLAEREGLIFKAGVPPQLCTTELESPPWSVGEIAYSVSVGFIILLVLISSCYAQTHKKDKRTKAVEQVLLCFSLQRSVKGLLKFPNHNPGLDIIDIYKIVYIIIIILGHRILLFSASVPVSDGNQHEELFRSVGYSLVMNGPLLVDFFFVASGTLLTYYLLSHLEKHGSANLLAVLVIRFLRLTPAYMVVVFFYATLFYRIGSGPLWTVVMSKERDNCQANWWTNILYIDNYINSENLCMMQSWYLSADTQLFIICIFVVYAIGRWVPLGYTLLTALSSLSVLVPIFNTWWRRTDALILPYPDALADVTRSEYFRYIYIRTENRAAPYFIGVFVGLILVKFKDSKYRMSLCPSLLCFAAMKVVLIGSIMASYPLYRPGFHHTYVQAGLYASLSRVFYGVSAGGVILLGRFGSLGILAELAKWKPFRVLGRLVYGVYLVHMTGQLYNIGSLRTPLQTGIFSCLWMVMGDVVFSFALSFLLTVLLESPVRALEKLVFQRDPHSHNKPESSVQSA